MRIRATPSSAQARQAAERSRTITGLCGRGDHHQCRGRVYVGHSFEDGAQYDPCRCDCHAETERKAA